MRRRRGMILVIVLVAIAMLSIGALTMAQLMLVERQAAELSVRQSQARASAESGVELARMFLAQPLETQIAAGGCYDNAMYFRGAMVNEIAAPEVPRHVARFSLVAPAVEEGYAGIRFGLEDESGKINLNALLLAEKTAEGSGRQILMGLPGMTEDVADAILDWIDPDDEPREFGAEADVYMMMDPPYAPRNGPLETVEELLLVQGVLPELLFGADANRNGMADAGELGSEMFAMIDPGDGSMDRGWAAYLTLYSLESNLRPDGQPKINVNQTDLQQLEEQLLEVFDEDQTTYILAFRQAGPYKPSGSSQTSGGSQTPGNSQSSGSSQKPGNSQPPGNSKDSKDSQAGASTGQLDLSKKARVKLKSVLDLIGGQVRVQFQGQQQPSVLDSPFFEGPLAMSEYLPTIMENLTVNENPILPGRININTAPRAVLLGIPGMDEEIVDEIIASRQPDPAQTDDPSYLYETWIYQQGIISLDQMKALMPFVTGRGSVYRVQSVGYFDKDGPHSRIEAVINASVSPPRVVFWRDITHLGRGYPLETLGVEYYGGY